MPPKTQINKDFLKAVFTEEKKLLKKRAITTVEVPKYDELSVKHLWPTLVKDKTFMLYFPDNFAENKYPSRSYFFDVLNTVHPEYLEQIMAHANKQRHMATGDAMANERIKISEAWQDELKSMPYLSSKYYPALSPLISFILIQESQARRSTC